MAILNQVIVEILNVAATPVLARALGSTDTPSPPSGTRPTSTPQQTTQAAQSNGPTSRSPLLFFVALGFGVVFTNLWIIVGVKYCFRYNARNRAIRNGEDPDPINLTDMPIRPHRRRREKKLMTMDEVNERFPLTKYKNWIASRAHEGLETAGGITAPSSRAGSLRNVDGVMPSSPTDTKHSVHSGHETTNDVSISPATNNLGGDFETENKDKMAADETNRLEEVQTTQTTGTALDKDTTLTREEEEEEDDHIHTAVPPELLTNPGDTCAICIDTLEEDDDIRGLTCGHAFHAGCLDPWLTSRRACCPLCKADYYTPKPRPEADAADSDRRRVRINMPQAPPSAWTGIRGNPRLMLVGGRFSTAPLYGDQYGYNSNSRANRRARAAAAASSLEAGEVAPAEPTTSRRWVPRISNPFSSIRMPALRPIAGSNHQPPAATEPDAPTATDASPSQLEAGVIR